MKITDFKDLVRHMPYLEQAFKIKKEIWFPEDEEKRFKFQNDKIKEIFGDEDSIMISRGDLLKDAGELKLFVIKVIMWGYPTKGRGKNIENILNPKNFNRLIEQLQIHIERKNINLEEIEELLRIPGLGLSTLSKILYFKKLKIESKLAMILDQRVINSINTETRFEDPNIEQFCDLKYENGLNYYLQYLAFLKELATQMNAQPDQVEMFLFVFGTTLKKTIGMS
ncbi:MAG: hypothetical protein A2066_09320 [Bacteroidetes bacterium GWB2_41_8]|nr:MAG: hypothetical protein A2066_09320 [Bacteroidetes bacterium GWB2_41_8]